MVQVSVKLYSDSSSAYCRHRCYSFCAWSKRCLKLQAARERQKSLEAEIEERLLYSHLRQ